MRSKNSQSLTLAETDHIERVKMLPCSVCNALPPSEAHHIKQGQHFTVVSLCRDCHRGGNGWHGDKTMFRIHKMDEIDSLAVTIRRLME